MNELNPIAFLQARSGKLWPPHDGTVVLHDDHPWVQLEDPEEVVQGGTGFTASRFAVYENADWLVHGDGLPNNSSILWAVVPGSLLPHKAVTAATPYAPASRQVVILS